MTIEEKAITETNFLAPAAELNTILRVYQAKKEFIEHVLREGVDFGKISGSEKPALLKPGAEKLDNLFSLYPTFDHVEMVKDWTGLDHGGEPFFHYHERANLWRVINGTRVLVASADGSCNSWEKKYRYRQQERVCPSCGKSTIIKGKQEYGGGWLCFAKKGGCGAKFQDGDQSIEGQQLGQIKNPDVADLDNTILKMAQKRALVAVTLIATAASDYFTQDIEDFIDGTFKSVVSPVEETNTITPETEESKANEQSKHSNGNLTLDKMLVNAKVAQNLPNARSIIKLLELDNLPIEEALVLGKHYRGFRDQNFTEDQSAAKVKLGEIPA